MIEYILRNAKGESHPLNTHRGHVAFDSTWTQGADSFEIESKVVERSFLPGSALIGDIRTKAREIELNFEYVHENTDEYRRYMNELLEAFYETKYIEAYDKDKTDPIDVGMRLEVVPQTVDVAYNDGSLKKHSENTLKFLALQPHWESLSLQTVVFGARYTKEGLVPGALAPPLKFRVDGNVPVLPRITLINQDLFKRVTVYLQESTNSFSFSTDFEPYPKYVEIVCNEGVLLLDGVVSNNVILGNSGFFPMPTGDNTLILAYVLNKPTASYTPDALSIILSWRPRFWL